MRALAAITKLEFRLSLRNPIYIFFLFAFPPMMMLLFGGMYGNEPSEFYNGYGAVDMLTPAYIAMVAAISGLMGLPLSLAEYRQHKVLKRYEAAPVSKPAIMWPHFLVNGALCLIGLALLLVIGFGAFGLRFYGNIGAFLLMLALSIASTFSVGFIIAAVVPNSSAASALAYLIYFPSLFLSGATIPLQIMPESVAAISKFIPLTYCVEVLQGAWLGQPLSELGIPILILTAIAVGCYVVAVKFFRWEA